MVLTPTLQECQPQGGVRIAGARQHSHHLGIQQPRAARPAGQRRHRHGQRLNVIEVCGARHTSWMPDKFGLSVDWARRYGVYIKGCWYRDHTEILYEGVRFWNQWRKENPNIRPSLYRLTLSELDLRKAELSSANLSYSTFLNCDLRGAYLSTAYMNGTQFRDTDLADANLDGAYLEYADLSGANLKGASLSLQGAWMSNFSGADRSEADLRNANLATVNLSGARLCSANLEGANLVETNLEGADLSGSDVYGVSAWNVQTDDETNQAQLHVRGGRYGEPMEAGFTVDGLELAQFVNLLLNNKNIRRAIDTITSKVVLLLGASPQIGKRC